MEPIAGAMIRKNPDGYDSCLDEGLVIRPALPDGPLGAVDLMKEYIACPREQ